MIWLGCTLRLFLPIEVCFTFDHIRLYFTGTLKMDYTLPVGKQVAFVLPAGGFDRFNNPTSLKTPPTCSVSDTAMLAVVQPDPATPDVSNSGLLQAIGGAGSAQFIVEDADEGPNPMTIIVNVT